MVYFFGILQNNLCYSRIQFANDTFYSTELLVKYASPGDKETQNNVLQRLSGYCGRPVTNYTLDEYPVDFEWNYFHSFWFSFIICSTVGKSFHWIWEELCFIVKKIDRLRKQFTTWSTGAGIFDIVCFYWATPQRFCASIFGWIFQQTCKLL